MANSKQAQKWQEALQQKQEVIHRTFSTPSGQECLKVLAATFQRGGALYHDVPTEMSRRIGRYEVVEYIVEMMEASTSHE